MQFILNMQFYLLRKSNVLPLLELTEKLGYIPNLMGIEGISTSDLESIENQLADKLEELRCLATKLYTQTIEVKYGELPIKIDVSPLVKIQSKPVKLGKTNSFYFQEKDLSFKTLKTAYEKGVLRDFILQKHNPETRDLEGGMRIEHPTYSNRVLPECLRGESVQDYVMWTTCNLDPSIIELFEDMPNCKT